MISQISGLYGERRAEANASKIAANNIAKREYQKEYMEYWNSTARLTKTGRPVEAIIAPLAPFASARPDRYKYYGCGFCWFIFLLEPHASSPDIANLVLILLLLKDVSSLYVPTSR